MILCVMGLMKMFLMILTYWVDALFVDFVRFFSFVNIYVGIMVMLFVMFNGVEFVLVINWFMLENLVFFILVMFVFAGFDAMATMKVKIGDDDVKFFKYFIFYFGMVILVFKILEFRKLVSVCKMV